MIRAMLLATLLALPAYAQQMTPESCRAGWEALNILIEEDAEMIAAQPDVTPKGLCRIDSSNAPLKQNDFESAEWRATGVEEAVTRQGVPLSLVATITGVDLIKGWNLPLPEQYSGPRGTARLEFKRDAQTHDITLKALNAEFGGLGHIKIRASGGGVDLSSFSAMQITSGGARVHDVTLQFQSTPVLKEALVPGLAAAMGNIFVQAIPETSIDADSRDALQRFMASGPDVAGLLRVSASSETGVGLLQMVGGVKPLEENGMSPEVLSQSMEILLSGVTVTAEWITIE